MFKDYTQKQLKCEVRKTIDEIGVCNSIKKYHPEKWDFFRALFERHSSYPEKFNGLTDIKINYNPVFKNQLETLIVKQNGEEDDVSVLKNCITGKPKDNLTIAMRNAILPQIFKFRNTNVKVCKLCKSTKNIQVDHHEPQFTDIKTNFIENIWKEKLPNKFKPNDSHSKVFIKDDSNFNKEWFDYHEQNALLRILCKKCNSTRPQIKRLKRIK